MDANKPDDSLLEEIETQSMEAARQAGQILCEQFSKPLEVEFKGKQRTDPVTSADRLSEEYLKRAISEKFPGHCILGEEGGPLLETDSPFVWVLDPLDGTANFMNGLPFFAVSVGVLWKRKPVVGSIWVPVSHRAAGGVYHARLGKGAFLDKEKIEASIKASGRPLAEIPVQFGSRFHLAGKSRKEPHEARNLGSIALEMAMAACGVFQYAVFGSPKIWDVAAGVLLVKEAGGLCYARMPGRKSWSILEQFQAEQNNSPEALENLRKWSFPVIAGEPEAAENMVKNIRSSHRPLSSLARLFRHRNQRSAAGPAK